MRRPLALSFMAYTVVAVPIVAFPLVCQAVTGSFPVGAHDAGTRTDAASTKQVAARHGLSCDCSRSRRGYVLS